MAETTKEFFSEIRAEFKEIGSKVNKVFDELVKGKSKGEFQVRVDVFTTATECVWELDLPGFDKTAVKVQLRDENLVISGSRQRQAEASEVKFAAEERKFGSFERIFSIPAGADASQVKAKFENGVLRVTMPYQQAATGDNAIHVD